MYITVVLAQLFWNSANLWPLAVIAGVVLLVLVFTLYPAQLKGMNSRWQGLLPAMRVLAILAIVIAILKPTLVRPRTQEEHGAVLLLVDRSASMGIADSGLSPGQRVALADTLGRLPEDTRQATAPEALRAIRELRRLADRAVRAESDLEYARLTSRQVERRDAEYEAAISEVAAVADELSKALAALSLSDTLKKRAEVLKKPPTPEERSNWRKEIAAILQPLELALEQRQSEADAKLYGQNAEVRQIADAIATESRLRLAEAAIVNERGGLLQQFGAEVPLFGYSFAEGIAPLPLRAGGENVKQLLVDADGVQSRLSGAVGIATDTLKGRSIRGVIVFSDGRSTGESVVARGGIFNVPVFGVVCGAERSFTDLAIASVEMPSSAYAGEDITVRATIGATNVAAGDYDVTLQCGDHREVKPVKLDGSGVATVEFSFTPEKPGVLPVQLDLKTIDGEASVQNNSYARPVKIIQDRLSVLLIGSSPTWDYQYVRNALTRSRWARLTDMIVEEGQLSITPETIVQQNVIVLFQPRAGAFTSQQIDAIYRAVTERGASVIMTAGTPEQLDALARNPVLAELLPYRAGSQPIWRSWPGDRPAFRIVPAAGTNNLDAIRLADDAAESQARWSNLPAVYHYLSVPQLKPNVIRTLLAEKESQLPVLVESRLGIGRVMFIGLQESWRWRMRVGEQDQDRFWLQLIRYSAEEPYAVVSEQMALDLDRVSARVGEQVRVRVRSTAGSAARGTPSLEISQDGRLLRIEQLTPAGALHPGRYDSQLRELPPGSYSVLARLPGNTASLELPLEIRKGLEEELADLSADPSTLMQLSSATGGTTVPLEQLPDLYRQLSQLKHQQGSLIEIPLWTSGYLFLFILACLAVEWAVRKRAGLA